MFRYSLSTLTILTAIGPPAIALFWFSWRPILILAIGCALSVLWIYACLALARFLAHQLVSGTG